MPAEAAQAAAGLTAIDLAIIAGYLLAMLGIGVWMAGRIRVYRDYFLAGGALTTPLLVCTLVSTYYELDVTFATSELGFDSGLVAWCWYSRPYYVMIFVAALVVVRRLKARGAAFLSLPDVIEASYGQPARIIGAVACLCYALPIAAMAGMTALFEALGWPPGISLAVGVGVCLVYTGVGGLWADAVSDTIQFVLMCVSLALAIPWALDWVGGMGFVERLPELHRTTTGGLSPWLLAAWAVSALTVLVEPAFYQRILAARDSRSVTRALLIGILLWAAYDWGVTLIGMMARAAVDQGLLPAALEGRQALVALCLTVLPVGLKGLFIAGILAAAMSSVDSYGLLASGNLVYDIYRPLARRPPDDRTLLIWTRRGVALALVAAALISQAFPRVADAWVFMAGALTSVVLVPVLGAIWLSPPPRAGLRAAAAGLAALVGFQVWIHLAGTWDPEQESWIWRGPGGVEIWREFAALFALPCSLLGFLSGYLFRGRSP